MVWAEFSCGKIEKAGSFEHNTKPSAPVKVGVFVHYLSDSYIARDNVAACSSF
jgi:hypothetical protein